MKGTGFVTEQTNFSVSMGYLPIQCWLNTFSLVSRN